MIPLLRRNRLTLGLDIGSGYVKGAVVDHSGAEPVLAGAAYLPLAPDTIVEGEIMDPSGVADALREVIGLLGVTARTVVTAIGGRDVIVKKILMDRMQAADAREVIRWEAEQYVPFDMEGVQLDFQILDPDAVGLQMNVLLVAAKRELVEQKAMMIRDAGVAASIVDVDAFALYNAFEANYPEAVRGMVALANVGQEVANILVLLDGVPVVTRDVPLGSRRLREEMKRLHGLSDGEADDVLNGRSERVAEFDALFARHAEELAMSVERAVAFSSVDADSGDGVGAVYLCGGGARLPRLAETVADRLRVRTEVVSPIRRLRTHPDALVHFPDEAMLPMLMLPIGLALRSAA